MGEGRTEGGWPSPAPISSTMARLVSAGGCGGVRVRRVCVGVWHSGSSAGGCTLPAIVVSPFPPCPSPRSIVARTPPSQRVTPRALASSCTLCSRTLAAPLRPFALPPVPPTMHSANLHIALASPGAAAHSPSFLPASTSTCQLPPEGEGEDGVPSGSLNPRSTLTSTCAKPHTIAISAPSSSALLSSCTATASSRIVTHSFCSPRTHSARRVRNRSPSQSNRMCSSSSTTRFASVSPCIDCSRPALHSELQEWFCDS
mmetsp:Transcript_21307/g.43232  ORF Transcript_21307/g.43232 Transcript_21307/m.43232 type:complete len:258 (+) Transcript_21307:359-1132(+)